MSANTLRVRSALCLVAALALTGAAIAQDAAPAPAPAPAPGPDAPTQKLIAFVRTVSGRLAQVRNDENAPWLRAEVGMQLGEGAEVRTGPGSQVQLTIPPGQVVTLDRLGTIKVLQAVRDGNKIKTDVGMQYGRARYQIEAGGLEYESNIHSPSAMLAIRGSDVIHQSDSFSSFAYGDGNLRFLSRVSREAVAFGNTGVSSRVTTEQLNAAANFRSEATLDSKGTNAGRTDEELALNEQNPNVSGNDLRNFAGLTAQSLVAGVAGGVSVPPPSTLIFALNFAGFDGLPFDADADLIITDPSGFQLTSAIGMTPDGKGTYDNDEVAVPTFDPDLGFIAGSGNDEVIYTRPLPGQYQVAITNPDQMGNPVIANVLFVLEGAEGQNPDITQVFVGGADFDPVVFPGADVNLVVTPTIISGD